MEFRNISIMNFKNDQGGYTVYMSFHTFTLNVRVDDIDDCLRYS